MGSYLDNKGVNTFYIMRSLLYSIFFLTKSLFTCWEKSGHLHMFSCNVDKNSGEY